jgi:hypothetical protein
MADPNDHKDDVRHRDDPCDACDDMMGCKGCAHHKENRAETIWYIVGLIAIIVVAVLLRHFGLWT